MRYATTKENKSQFSRLLVNSKGHKIETSLDYEDRHPYNTWPLKKSEEKHEKS